MSPIYIHEKFLSLNLYERAVQPLLVYWKKWLLPMFSSSHKRNMKGAVVPFIESVSASVTKLPRRCVALFFSLSAIYLFIFSDWILWDSRLHTKKLSWSKHTLLFWRFDMLCIQLSSEPTCLHFSTASSYWCCKWNTDDMSCKIDLRLDL